MRSYCALYVDVGYLLAAAATRVTGTSLRKGIVVSYPDLVARLIKDAEAASGLPLLRLHWYDSGNRAGGTPDSTQEAIGMLPRVKLRLGRASPQGEQKGVDLRIGLDVAVVDDTVHVRQLQPETEVPLTAAAAAVDVPLPGPRVGVSETPAAA